VKLKEMGFNMVRKHIKVEPSRYYYHADTMGFTNVHSIILQSLCNNYFMIK